MLNSMQLWTPFIYFYSSHPFRTFCTSISVVFVLQTNQETEWKQHDLWSSPGFSSEVVKLCDCGLGRIVSSGSQLFLEFHSDGSVQETGFYAKYMVIGPGKSTLIARFMGPSWGPSGADRTQVGPMLAPSTLLSGITSLHYYYISAMPSQITDQSSVCSTIC